MAEIYKEYKCKRCSEVFKIEAVVTGATKGTAYEHGLQWEKTHACPDQGLGVTECIGVFDAAERANYRLKTSTSKFEFKRLQEGLNDKA